MADNEGAAAPRRGATSRSLRRIVAAVLQALAMPAANGADGSCAAVIEAIDHARQQARVAQLLVDGSNPPAADPVTLRIGDLIYEDFDGVSYATRRATPNDPLADALRRAQRDGTAACEYVDDQAFAGDTVARYRFVHPDVAPGHNPVTLLVSRASGLPLFHSYRGIGAHGFYWIYGERVHAPVSGAGT